MNTVLLHPDGHMTVDRKTVAADALMVLGHKAQLVKGFTLRSFFRLVEFHEPFLRLNAFMPDCLAQYRASPASACRIAGIDHLELSKTIEMIGFPGQPQLEIFTSLCAVGESEGFDLRDFHIEHLLDTPLKLGRLKHVVFGDEVDVFEFDTVFNLFEFIEAIVWEFSFHGTPKECALRR